MEIENINDWIIQKYKEDEEIMIRLFIQWCQNYQLDPIKIYHRAYPEQPKNQALQTILDDMDNQLDIEIPTESMIDVLQMFGNDDLAFIIAEEIDKIRKE